MKGEPTNNLFISGKEWRAIRRKERDSFKKRAIGNIESMKWRITDELMNIEELSWKTRENDCYDACIKIITNLATT